MQSVSTGRLIKDAGCKWSLSVQIEEGENGSRDFAA